MKIKGIISPILTPMDEREEIDFEELRKQVNRQIDAGVHGLFAFGTNGEGYILSAKEKEKVLRTVVEESNNRVPIYAGTGCISTKETIEQSRMAKFVGADILSIVTPFFAAASQEELYQHYKTVAEAVNMPIILYNIPARTGNKITQETAERLSKIDNIVGVKDSSGDFNNMLSYLEISKDGNFAVLSGNDSLILPCLKAGGVGGIAGCANVYPHVLVSIYERFVAGDLAGALEAQESIVSFRACFKYGNPNTIVKLAVALLGYPVGRCRSPFNYVSEEGIKTLEKVLKENAEKGMN